MGKSSWINNFEGRNLQAKYGNDAIILYALELKFPMLDIESVASDILIDGGGDKKADLVYVNEDDGYAVIAQGYYSPKAKSSARANKASDLNSAISWLLRAPADKMTSPEFKAAADQFTTALKDEKIETVYLWYVHNQPESQNVRSEIEIAAVSFQERLNALYPNQDLKVIGEEVGESALGLLYQRTVNDISIDDKITLDLSSSGFQMNSKEWTALLASISLKSIYKLFSEYKENLFSANVRGYLGSVNKSININSGIKATALNDPENFFIYNNGITLLTNSFDYIPEKKQVTVQGISIINGAQTTGAVGSLKESEVSGNVAVRIVTSNNTSTLRKIVEYNNKQNAVTLSDFRSNDSIQKRLRDEFKDYKVATYTGARRGGAKDQISRKFDLISTDALAQVLSAYKGDPVRAYQDKKKIWDENAAYDSIFNAQTNARNIVFVYSLYLSLLGKKQRLKEESQLNEQDTKLREFLSTRGALWLCISAIAKCLDILLSTKISDNSDLYFKSVESLEEAVSNWTPILDIYLLGFAAATLTPAVVEGLKSKSVASSAIETYVSSTRPVIETILKMDSNNKTSPLRQFKDKVGML